MEIAQTTRIGKERLKRKIERIPDLRWLFIFGVTAILVTGGWYLLQLGGNAPNFSLTGLDGNVFRLSDYRGKIVLLDFMATWCGPCRASIPGLKEIYEKHAGQIIMMSVSVDPVHDTKEVLTIWMNSYNATWIHARDTANPPVSQLYKIKFIPTYVIIDKKGNIRYTHEGLTPEETISGEILELLRE